jgi:hypothetical protein
VTAVKLMGLGSGKGGSWGAGSGSESRVVGAQINPIVACPRCDGPG